MIAILHWNFHRLQIMESKDDSQKRRKWNPAQSRFVDVEVHPPPNNEFKTKMWDFIQQWYIKHHDTYMLDETESMDNECQPFESDSDEFSESEFENDGD